MQTSPAGAHYYCTCTQIKYKTQEPYPQSRNKHVSCLHDNFVYIYAGKDGTISLRDFWRFNLGSHTWSQISFRGDNPSHLEGHTLVSYKKLLLLFGGEFGDALTESSLWIINPDLGYIRRSCVDPGSEGPSVRRHHSAVVYRGRMFVYGGYVDMKGSSRELWQYRIDDEEWDLMLPRQSAQGIPNGLHGHSAVVYTKNMWIYGGMSDLVPRQDLWCFSFVSSCWDRVKFKYGPPPLTGHSAVVVGSAMFIFGGECNREPVNQLWCFCFRNELWIQVRCDQQIPSARMFHSAVMISSLSKAEDTVKASSMPYLQHKVKYMQLERPRTSPSSGSQGRMHFSDKHFTDKDLRPQMLNLRENCSSCESLKINPSPQENTQDQSPLMPKTDLNYNAVDILNKNSVQNGIDNPGISKSTEELIRENQLLKLSVLNQENEELNKVPFLRSQSHSAQFLLSEEKGQHSVRHKSGSFVCSDMAATENTVTELGAKKFRHDPELIIEDLEYLDCFPHDIKIPYPNSRYLGSKLVGSLKQNDCLNEDVETIELVDVQAASNDIQHYNGQNLDSSKSRVQYSFNPYRSENQGYITNDTVAGSTDRNSAQRQYYESINVCNISDSKAAGNVMAIEMKEAKDCDIKLSPVLENGTCETSFGAMEDQTLGNQSSDRRRANKNKANNLESGPYMLIFGGKETQGTNFGIKPLTVWKCQLKRL